MALCTGKWIDSDQHPSQLPLFPSSESNFSRNRMSAGWWVLTHLPGTPGAVSACSRWWGSCRFLRSQCQHKGFALGSQSPTWSPQMPTEREQHTEQVNRSFPARWGWFQYAQTVLDNVIWAAVMQGLSKLQLENRNDPPDVADADTSS